MADGKARNVRPRVLAKGGEDGEALDGVPETPPTRPRLKDPIPASAATAADPATPSERTPQNSQQAAERDVWGVDLKGRAGGRKEALSEEGALAGFGDENEEIDQDSGLPYWARDLDFLTEPLEGNKASYILRNSEVRLPPSRTKAPAIAPAPLDAPQNVWAKSQPQVSSSILNLQAASAFQPATTTWRCLSRTKLATIAV